jgi:hypothetical protein
VVLFLSKYSEYLNFKAFSNFYLWKWITKKLHPIKVFCKLPSFGAAFGSVATIFWKQEFSSTERSFYQKKRVYFESKQCLVRFIQNRKSSQNRYSIGTEKISKIMLQTTALKVDIDSLKAAVSTPYQITFTGQCRFYYQKNQNIQQLKL